MRSAIPLGPPENLWPRTAPRRRAAQAATISASGGPTCRFLSSSLSHAPASRLRNGETSCARARLATPRNPTRATTAAIRIAEAVANPQERPTLFLLSRGRRRVRREGLFDQSAAIEEFHQLARRGKQQGGRSD